MYFAFANFVTAHKSRLNVAIDLWEWLLVGVAMANKRITDVEPERAVPVALMTTILHD